MKHAAKLNKAFPLKNKIHRAARQARYRFSSPALILMYHRVVELRSDPYLLAVTPQHFTEHLEVIRQMGNPIRLTELVEALKSGQIPSRAVVITFDDGYADNMHRAEPLLENNSIPATVFVTAGQVGSRQEFWWDELDRLLLQPGTLPRHLRLEQGRLFSEWDLGEAAVYSESDFQKDQGWHIERPDDPGRRQQLFQHLFDRLMAADVQERQELLQNLRVWAGLKTGGRSTHRALTPGELLDLTRSSLVEIGAHSSNHPSLALLSADDQRQEIRQSKQVLEDIIGRPVRSFAYPNGSYNTQTIKILQQEGFECACSNRPDAVWKGADPFQLPRLNVRDMDRDAFTRWLKGWMEG